MDEQNKMVNVNIRMSLELKRQFEACCKEMGLNMTSAVNVFAKAVVREQGLPFDVRLGGPEHGNEEEML